MRRRTPLGIGGGGIFIPSSSQGIAAFERFLDCFPDFPAVFIVPRPAVNDWKTGKEVLHADEVLLVMALTGMSPFAAMKILTAPSISRLRPLSHAPCVIFFRNASLA